MQTIVLIVCHPDGQITIVPDLPSPDAVTGVMNERFRDATGAYCVLTDDDANECISLSRGTPPDNVVQFPPH